MGFKYRLAYALAAEFGRMARRCRDGVTDMLKIEGAIFQLNAMQALREAAIGVTAALCVILVFFLGLLFLHLALFAWLNGNGRMALTIFWFGLAETGVPLAAVIWVLSSKRWLEAAMKTNEYLKKTVMEKEAERRVS